MHCEERVLARRAGGGSRAGSCARRKVLASGLSSAQCAAARHKSQRGVNGQRGGARLESLKHALKKDMSQVRMAFSVERARPAFLRHSAGRPRGPISRLRIGSESRSSELFCAFRNWGTRKYKIEYDLIRLLTATVGLAPHGSSHTHGSGTPLHRS